MSWQQIFNVAFDRNRMISLVCTDSFVTINIMWMTQPITQPLPAVLGMTPGKAGLASMS